MDNASVEEVLSELIRAFEESQEPVQRVFDVIESFMNKSNKTENLELLEFKLELSTILENFYEEMVNVHTRFIDSSEKIEKMIE